MDYKKERQKIIESAKKSLVELRKVAEQKIDIHEVEPERIKQAAASKKLAIEDSFSILQLIQDQEEILTGVVKEQESKDIFGVETRIK